MNRCIDVSIGVSREKMRVGILQESKEFAVTDEKRFQSRGQEGRRAWDEKM